MSTSIDTLIPPLAIVGRSRSPQEETAAKLPPALLCEPCRTMLRGESAPYTEEVAPWYEFVHHDDAKSFQKALELPCDFCVRLHKAFEIYEGYMSTYRTGPTRYSFNKFTTERITLAFQSGSDCAYPDIELYDLRPDLHYQHITANTGDAKALSFLRGQLHGCRTFHPKCSQLAPHNYFLPTRVIYVGSAEDDVVRLCERVESTTPEAYTVLSHCWGKDPDYLMLTKATAQILREGVPVPRLPKTFQHAITVTRRFQKEYIWIDSLCIFQDDLHDWATEARRMREVYSKSAFCIAATAAQSGDTGLFFDRDVHQLTPIVVELTCPEKMSSMALWPASGTYLFGFHSLNLSSLVNSSPLNRRAWVAQERFLSPRILHFTREVLAWECHESYTHESYAKTSVDASSIDPLLDPSSLKRVLNSIRWQGPDIVSILRSELFNGARFRCQPSDDTDKLVKNTIYQAWGQFLHDYSGVDLTKESDIFVALNGVAEEVGIFMNDRLVAGLWEGRLIEDMCWRITSDSCRRPMAWRAPSWSWASITGQTISAASIIWPSWTREEDRFPHEMAAVVKMDIATKPSGELEQASVLLECRIIPVNICSASDSSFRNAWCTMTKGKWPSSMAETFAESKPSAEAHGAFEIMIEDHNAPRYHNHKVIDAQLLVLVRRGASGETKSLQGICIVESTSHPGAFERIGYFELQKEDAISVRAAYEQARVQTILLV